LASLLTALAYAVAGGEGGWAVPAVFAVSIVANAVYSTYTAVFRAVGHAGWEGANELGSRIAVLALGAVVVASGGGLLAIVCVYAVVDLMSLAVLTWLFNRTTQGHADVEHPQLGLREARSLAAAGIVSMFYFRVDSWLLALIKGNR